MLRATLLALVALAAAACTHSLRTSPAPSPAPTLSTTDPESTGLAGVREVKSAAGVSAWLVSEPSIPIVAIEMAWRGGSALEADDKLGASWILGYMMNEGAGGLDSQAFATRMEDLNMGFGCQISDDWTRCSFSTLSSNLDEAIDLMRLALLEPRFDAEPIERAKRELIVSLARAETNPSVLASRAMEKHLMPDHPYSRIMTPDTVNSVTRDDLVRLKKDLMTRDRLMVSVVGDISGADLGPVLDHVFKDLPLTSDLVDELPDVAAPNPPDAPIVTTFPSPQTLVLFSGPGMDRADPDFYAAYVLNYILGGGGFSSRLMDDIREKRGLTYGIGTGLSLARHVNRWTGSAQTKNETALEVVELVKGHLSTLQHQGPNAKELEDAKAYLTGAYPLSFDSNAKIADNLMSVRMDGLGLDYVAKRNDYINAVSLEDLKRVAAQYFDPNGFTFVLVGQPQ